jgi:undecaprenyl-diphosphatase
MAILGFIAYVCIKRTPSHPLRHLILFVAAVFIIAIGFSRLYLDVHYLSDVLGGYLLGSLWLIIGICLVELPIGKAFKFRAGLFRRSR